VYFFFSLTSPSPRRITQIHAYSLQTRYRAAVSADAHSDATTSRARQQAVNANAIPITDPAPRGITAADA
jgi:hypothetical protein